MNDQLIMDIYLLILKSTVEVYVHGTLEASNKQVKSLLKECLNDILSSQENTYNEMTKYGWYSVNNVDDATIQETYNKLQNKN